MQVQRGGALRRKSQVGSEGIRTLTYSLLGDASVYINSARVHLSRGTDQSDSQAERAMLKALDALKKAEATFVTGKVQG